MTTTFDLLLQESIEAVVAFMELGGEILFVIFFVTVALWTLILERLWYTQVVHRLYFRKVVKEWNARSDRHSWNARQIRRMLASQVMDRMESSLPMIKALVAVCPLLGLLGTVTGMIEVFDVLSSGGSGNARAMASGVSRATIPTMAGMVAALSGVYMSAQLQRFVLTERIRVDDGLALTEVADVTS